REVALGLMRQPVEHRTFLEACGITAVSQHSLQLDFQLPQLIHPLTHLGQPALSQPPRLLAPASAAYCQQFGDLVQAESHRLRPANELESAEVLGVIPPDAAHRPRGLFDEPTSLVIADRLDV